MCDLRDEVYGFFGGFIKFLIFQLPIVAAISALQNRRCPSEPKSCLPEYDGLQLVQCESENFSFDILQFTDADVDFRDFSKLFLLGYFGRGFQNSFCKCPFMHEKANGW